MTGSTGMTGETGPSGPTGATGPVTTILYGTADLSFTAFQLSVPETQTVSTTIPTSKILWFGGVEVVTTSGSPAILATYVYRTGGLWYASATVVDTVNTSNQSATVRVYYTYTA